MDTDKSTRLESRLRSQTKRRGLESSSPSTQQGVGLSQAYLIKGEADTNVDVWRSKSTNDALSSEMEFDEIALHSALRQVSDDIKIKILRSLARRPRIPPSIFKIEAWLGDGVAGNLKKAVCDMLQSSYENFSNHALKVVVAWLEDEDRDVRKAALDALGSQSTLPNDVLTAIAARSEDQNKDIREASLYALGVQSNLPGTFLMAILARLQDEDPEVREVALDALGNQSTLLGHVLDTIVTRPEGGSWHSGGDTVCAQGSQLTFSEETIMAIVARLGDENPDVRVAATRALRSLSTLPSNVRTAITAQLEDKYFIRRAVVNALGSRSNADAPVAMAAQIKDEQLEATAAALDALDSRPPLPNSISNTMAQPKAILKSDETGVSVEKHHPGVRREAAGELLPGNSENIIRKIPSASKDGPRSCVLYFNDSGYETATYRQSSAGVQSDNPTQDETSSLRAGVANDSDCSDIASIAASDREDYVSKIAGDLIDKLMFSDDAREQPRASLDTQAMERVTGGLEKLLKAFALKIGHTSHNGIETQINRDVMVFVYRHGKSIAQIFKENYSRLTRGSSQSDDVIDTERDDSPGMTPHEKVDYWSIDNDNPLAGNPFDCTNEGADIYKYPSYDIDDDDDENETEASEDVPGGKIDARLSKYHEFLSETTAYHWLLSRLRQELDLISAELDIMVKVSDTIISSLSSHHVSRKTSSQSYTMTFEVDWNPQSFIREQEYKEEAGEAIGMALTLTGSTKDAQALNCAQYLAQTWPSTGSQILRLVQDVVRTGLGRQYLPDNTKITAQIQGQKLIAEASGTGHSLAEIGEQLAWLGAALRSPPEKLAGVYCRPEIVPINTDKSLTCSWNRCWNISFKFHSEVDSPSPPSGHCWLKLFRSPVVAEGYPILTRPEYNTGLEITLNLAAELIQAQRAVIFDERVFVKGFCAMLVLAKRLGDVFIWHLVVNEDESHISYLDPRISGPPSYDSERIVLSGLESARHVVGWCQDAESYTGETNSRYDFNESLLDTPHDKFSPYGTPLLHGIRLADNNNKETTALGIKDKAFIYYRTYVDRLSWLQEKNWVVLYDVKDCRAWFVDGANALLHLVRVSLGYERSHPDRKHRYKFQMTEYDYALNRSEHRALNILENRINRDQTLLDESNETFEQRVNDLSLTLELVLADQEKLNKNVTIRGNLEGFLYEDIVRKNDRIRRCMRTLRPTRAIWQNFTRKTNAAVLFGYDFGELIKPSSPGKLCPFWAMVPTGMDYLAVRVSDVKRVLRDSSYGIAVPWRLIDDVYWYAPYDKPCECSGESESTGDGCQRAQVLLSRIIDNAQPRFASERQLPDGGAVVFGYNLHYDKYLREDCDNAASSSKTNRGSSIGGDSGYGSASPDRPSIKSDSSVTVMDRGVSLSSNRISLAPERTLDTKLEDVVLTLQPTDHRSSGASPVYTNHTVADKKANNTTGGPTPPSPSHYGHSIFTTVVVIAFIAANFDINFYWRTVLISLLTTLLYCTYVIPMQWSWRPTRNFLISSIGVLIKGVGLFLLLTWLLFLSPVHTTSYTLIDEWTEYLDHPPYEPSKTVYGPGETSKVDVFAIHGLGSNPSSAWRHHGNETDVHWLEDILPKQAGLEQIRVTTLNHQTRWDSHVPDIGFSAHAQKMLNEIKRINQRKRPIVFIAHSFGGLLLKQALVLDNKQSKQVIEKTRGILFLAVPHYGTRATFLASLLSCTAYWRGSSTALLEYMSEGSPALKTLDDDFYDVCVRPGQTRGMHVPYIGNFLEMRPERVRMWSLGPTVNPESGKLQYATNEYLDADHRGINKFPSSADPNFRTFLTHFNCAISHGTNRMKTEKYLC